MSKVIESSCGNVTILAGDEVKDMVYATDSAKKRIVELMEDEDEGSFLRIGVVGGGCSGFNYMFGIHNEIEEGDIVNDWGDGKLVTDDMSINYLKGSTVDYIREVGGEFFKVHNPEASSNCGCGTSFNHDYEPDYEMDG